MPIANANTVALTTVTASSHRHTTIHNATAKATAIPGIGISTSNPPKKLGAASIVVFYAP